MSPENLFHSQWDVDANMQPAFSYQYCCVQVQVHRVDLQEEEITWNKITRWAPVEHKWENNCKDTLKLACCNNFSFTVFLSCAFGLHLFEVKHYWTLCSPVWRRSIKRLRWETVWSIVTTPWLSLWSQGVWAWPDKEWCQDDKFSESELLAV